MIINLIRFLKKLSINFIITCCSTRPITHTLDCYHASFPCDTDLIKHLFKSHVQS